MVRVEGQCGVEEGLCGVEEGLRVSIAGDGKCVVCDSYVRPCTLVRICDECNYGSYQVGSFFDTLHNLPD